MSPQHEHSAVLAAFKLIFLALLLGAVGGLGYWFLTSRVPTVVEGTMDVGESGVESRGLKDMEELPVDEDRDGWVGYENETLDVLFDVPAEWQTIGESQESGLFATEEVTIDEEGTVVFTCETHTSLAVVLGDARTEFLTADDNGDCQTLGRGGYWGDMADRVTSAEALAELCSEILDGVCQLNTNRNGLVYAHVHYDSIESWGTILEDVDEYYFFHEGHDWDGIVISDAFFVQSGLDYDVEFEGLVQFLEFQP